MTGNVVIELDGVNKVDHAGSHGVRMIHGWAGR